jgi:hypothetical protein
LYYTGNIFRSVTLLAATWCELQPDLVGFDPVKALTNENLESFMTMLSFGKFNGKYDTRIHGLGMDMLVSEVQNTELKSPKVSKNIPTVAEVTQGTWLNMYVVLGDGTASSNGMESPPPRTSNITNTVTYPGEVILFAASAVETMGKDGLFVLLEGREQTVNYVRTPHRFTLILSDDSLIGKRRAAQRLMADALSKVVESSSDDAVTSALEECLQEMAKEAN